MLESVIEADRATLVHPESVRGDAAIDGSATTWTKLAPSLDSHSTAEVADMWRRKVSSIASRCVSLNAGDHRRDDRAGTDAVDTNVPGGVAQRRASGQADYAMLGCVVGREVNLADEAARGCHIDDRTAAVRSHLPKLVFMRAIPRPGLRR